MAFRSEALLAFCLAASASFSQPWEFTATHSRLLRDRPAEVRVDESGVTAKRGAESREWSWDNIQRLTLSEGSMHILSYEDSRWRAGRDREWMFTNLPVGAVQQMYPFLLDRLGAKLDARIAVAEGAPDWEMPAKLREGFGGADGTLASYSDRIVFRSAPGNDSRTWLIQHVESVGASGPYDLTIRVPPHDFSFQLKRSLSEQQYDSLWRQIQQQRLK